MTAPIKVKDEANRRSKGRICTDEDILKGDSYVIDISNLVNNPKKDLAQPPQSPLTATTNVLDVNKNQSEAEHSNKVAAISSISVKTEAVEEPVTAAGTKSSKGSPPVRDHSLTVTKRVPKKVNEMTWSV